MGLKLVNLEEKLAEILVGKKIKAVQFMTEENAEQMMWDERPLLIVFEDNSLIFAQRDPEGNGPGALNYQDVDDEKDRMICPI